MIRLHAGGPSRFYLCPECGAVREDVYRGGAIIAQHWHDGPGEALPEAVREEALAMLETPSGEQLGLWSKRESMTTKFHIYKDLMKDELKDAFSGRELELSEALEPVGAGPLAAEYSEHISTVLNYYAAKVGIKQNRRMTVLTVVFGIVAILELATAIIQILVAFK
jgi:hypothetical protein